MAAGKDDLSKTIKFIVIISCVKHIWTHTCGHRVPKQDEVVHGVPVNMGSSRHKRSTGGEQLRIHLVYEGSVSRLQPKDQIYIKNDLIPGAVKYWEETLRVLEPVDTPIRLLRACKTNKVRYDETGEMYPYCVGGCKATTTCGETEVPPDHLMACREVGEEEQLVVTGEEGAGVSDTDFLLYVSAHDTSRCGVGTTVAYAAYCQLEADRDRPIAGYFNLCPKQISSLPHDTYQMLSTIKHEILHALGFSAGLFAFFRAPDGTPLTERRKADGKPNHFNTTLSVYQWSDRVVREIVRDDWAGVNGNTQKVVQMMVTPNVVREARHHFNCDTLEGAELEDQGVIGTALTHWEKRVFENEAMTGTYTQNPMISKITLAFMEDTGWYGVDYNKAENLQWGRSLGCDFVKKSCYYWMSKRQIKEGQVRSPHPFCVNARVGPMLHSECPSSRSAVVVCNLVQYERPLNLIYQHFNTLAGIEDDQVPLYAGAVQLADYCPYLQELDWKKEETVVRGSQCHLVQNNAEPEINYNLEKYGSDSICLEHATPWTISMCSTKHDVDHWGSGCYQFSCSESEGLIVHIQNKSYRCYRGSQIIQVQAYGAEWLHDGTIVCPNCTEVCQPRGIPCPPEETPPVLTSHRLSPPCANQASSSSTHPLLFFILLLLIKNLGMGSSTS